MKSSQVPAAMMSQEAAGGPSGSRSSIFGGVKPGSIREVAVEMLEFTVQLCRCVCVCVLILLCLAVIDGRAAISDSFLLTPIDNTSHTVRRPLTHTLTCCWGLKAWRENKNLFPSHHQNNQQLCQLDSTGRTKAAEILLVEGKPQNHTKVKCLQQTEIIVIGTQ